MKTLLIRNQGEPPAEVRDILRAGSTEMHEVRGGESRDATDADRVVVWNGGDIEVRAKGDCTRLHWPEDEDKLKMFFMTSA
jgi:hypothetical protein